MSIEDKIDENNQSDFHKAREEARKQFAKRFFGGKGEAFAWHYWKFAFHAGFDYAKSLQKTENESNKP